MVASKSQTKQIHYANIFKKTETVSSQMFLHPKIKKQRPFQLGDGSSDAGRLKGQDQEFSSWY